VASSQIAKKDKEKRMIPKQRENTHVFDDGTEHPHIFLGSLACTKYSREEGE